MSRLQSVLCYGDSNTHGKVHKALPGERFGPLDRWPGVLRHVLGASWTVIEEGLNGRTTIHDDPVEGIHRNGRRFLKTCLESHRPLDLVIFMLGTNDLKACYGQTVDGIGLGVESLISETRRMDVGPQGKTPDLMIVAPPTIQETLVEYATGFAGAYAKSQALAGTLWSLAQREQAHYFDANSVANTLDSDGVHMSRESHRQLGAALAECIGEIFPSAT